MNMKIMTTTTREMTNYREKQKFTRRQPKMLKIVTKSNSKNRFVCSNFIILIFLITCGFSKINAVPTDSTGTQMRPLLLQRALRDVATMMTASLVQEEPKDMLATSTETLLDQPQGQCLLNGVLVAGTSVDCEQKVGCRAIQKTGHCCPDYKCDCQSEGKTYSNGDKLVDPETPCRVCYCKSGEIQCSSAVCFHRDDCTPRYIPGRCCPEYDNCPVTNKTMVSSTPAPKPDLPPQPPAAAFNLNITIKEITKPTEIRITDENKAKPIHQMLKTSTTTTTTTTTEDPSTSLSSTTQAVPSSTTTTTILTLVKDPENHPFADSSSFSTINKNVIEPMIPPAIKQENYGSQALENIGKEQGNDSSKVNIKREFMYQTTEGSLKPSFNETNGELTSAELLNWNPETGELNGSLLQTEDEIEPETAGSDNIYHIILSTDGPSEIYAGGVVDETVPKLSGTTEGFNPESSNEAIALPSSTEGVLNMEKASTSESSKISELTTDAPEASKPTDLCTNDLSTTESIKTSTHHMEEDDTALPVEANPAYPSLPEDDFSIRDVNLPLTETDDTIETDLKDHSRSYADQHLSGTKEMEDLGSGSGDSKDIPSVLDDVQLAGSTSNPKPEKVQIMYSMEEPSSAETTIANSSDFQLEKIMRDLAENETGSGDSLEMTSSLESIVGSDFGSGMGGSGNGSEEFHAPSKLVKEREPTTPSPKMQRATTELDIDELGSNASGDGKSDQLEDPKHDAESIKANEEENAGVVQADLTAPENDIVSVKLNPKQEKTLEEQ